MRNIIIFLIGNENSEQKLFHLRCYNLVNKLLYWPNI